MEVLDQTETGSFDDRLRAAQLNLFYISLNTGREAMKLAKSYPEPDIARKYHLTARESEILRLMREGNNVEPIRQKLYITEHTVKYYRTNIYRKLGAQSSTEAIALANQFREGSLISKHRALDSGIMLLSIAGNALTQMPRFDTGDNIKDPGTLWEFPTSELAEELKTLTPSEREILGMLPLGLTDLEIANQRGSSREVVRFHRSNMYKKIGVRNRVEAVIFSHAAGLMDMSSKEEADNLLEQLLEKLTAKELDVLGMASLGLENSEIGHIIFVRTSTVKFHLYSAFRKLGVRNRVEAAVLAINAELLVWAKDPKEPKGLMVGTIKALEEREKQGKKNVETETSISSILNSLSGGSRQTTAKNENIRNPKRFKLGL